ncbi:MAG TPA: hypothetical protein ENF79_05870 [Nitrososphaeria archaeon]|nr:hypothetical protein [Nitrososphaeria archaeon]
MAKAILGYGLGLGLITLAGLPLGFKGLTIHTSGQFNLFIILLRAYSPLLTPFSSALGYPIIGGSPSLGILPLAIWISIGCILGLLLRSAGGAAKAMFLTSATVIILWIGSLFLSAPIWPDQYTWLTTISALAKDLISRPIDLGFILVGPMIISAAAGQLLEAMRERLMKDRRLEDEYSVLY